MQHLQLHSNDNLCRIKLSESTKSVAQAKKIVVLTGAGISCNAGIPDFRSANGLYNMAKAKDVGLSISKGQDLFDISLFRSEATIELFATFMESLYGHTIQAKPTETHNFINHLKRKNKLLRCYTQNIDALERKIKLNTGVVDGQITGFRKHWNNLDVVQLHGDLNYLTCTHCSENYPWIKEFRDSFACGEIPECPKCVDNYIRKMESGKRLSSLTVGILRPKIVLYGENHPNSEGISRGLSSDIKAKPDCLIIVGTSLKVDGVKKLVRTMSKEIHERGGKVLFINKTAPASTWKDSIDYFVQSDCDSWINHLKDEIPDLFLSQYELDQLRLKNQTIKKQTKKNNSMMTPPPSPGASDIDSNFSLVDNEVNSAKKVNMLKEQVSPSYSPIKKETDRKIELSKVDIKKVKTQLRRVKTVSKAKDLATNSQGARKPKTMRKAKSTSDITNNGLKICV